MTDKPKTLPITAESRSLSNQSRLIKLERKNHLLTLKVVAMQKDLNKFALSLVQRTYKGGITDG